MSLVIAILIVSSVYAYRIHRTHCNSRARQLSQLQRRRGDRRIARSTK